MLGPAQVRTRRHIGKLSLRPAHGLLRSTWLLWRPLARLRRHKASVLKMATAAYDREATGGGEPFPGHRRVSLGSRGDFRLAAMSSKEVVVGGG